MPRTRTGTLSDAEVQSLIGATCGDPFSLLGPHATTVDGRPALVVRSLQPAARRIDLVAGSRTVAMSQCHPAGLFEAVLDAPDGTPYRFRVTYADGHVAEQDDPYRYGRVLSEYDLYLLTEGTHARAFDTFGAHRRALGSTTGVHFAVWAPNAERVSVLGDFNGWDGRVHPMRMLRPNGIWEIFMPDLPIGERYKFEIRSTRGGAVLQKTDPYGVFFERPPASASIVWDLTTHEWRDEAWMASRAARDHWMHEPMAIYELHLGSWRRVPERDDAPLTYLELADQLIPYVKAMGFTHIELLPVMEHPFSGSWGYQVVGFFAPTSRFGPPEDFKAFVDACHRHDIGVILDWVPGHFPKDAHGLAQFDGTALYEHEDPRQGEHQDWGTLIFNYGRREVRNFLLSNARFWLDEYHVDGLRVDAVASMLYLDYSRRAGEWVPNRYGGRENLDVIDLIRQMNVQTHADYPGSITIAEESTSWPGVSRPAHLGGLGFTYKWNMGWMHDTLEYVSKDPVYRRWAHDEMTFSMLYAYSENFVLPLSHDEVVHGKGSMLGKMPGDLWQQCATLRAFYGFMIGHPGKKLLFMGDEFGQASEWNHDASLDWHLLGEPAHAGLQRWVRDLLAVYRREASLYEQDHEPAGFEWIDCSDHESSVYSFLRRARNPRDYVLLVLNFTPVPRVGYRIGVPELTTYIEVLNSDSLLYGGSNVGNGGAVAAGGAVAHGRPASLDLTLPPLGCLLLKPAR
jgi:1,4-alpha-glucan branching enzyme